MPTAAARGLDERVALQAARGFLRLASGEATPAEHRQWEHWRAADPHHALAWQRAEQLSRKFDLLPKSLALPVLGREVRADRRAMVRTLAALLVAVPSGWLAWRASPWSDIGADLRTATGEQRVFTLADGSRVLLDTASAVDVRFDGSMRRLLLRTGAILVTTAADPARAHRPFVVHTTHGRLRALGTRFSVRVKDGHTQVAVFEGAVEVQPRDMGVAGIAGVGEVPALVLQAGEATVFAAGAADAARPLDPRAESWTRGVLQASNMRLADFAAELGRYRPGILHCDPAVADLRISGVFQLRDTTAVLDSLPQALRVDVLYRTRYWVSLRAPQP